MQWLTTSPRVGELLNFKGREASKWKCPLLLVASLLLVAMPGAPRSFLLLLVRHLLLEARHLFLVASLFFLQVGRVDKDLLMQASWRRVPNCCVSEQKALKLLQVASTI